MSDEQFKTQKESRKATAKKPPERKPLSPEEIADREKKRAAMAIFKQGKLRELAAKRVPVAVKRIQLVGNLTAYRPTEQQSQAIIDMLQNAVNDVKAKFRGTVQTQLAFNLPS